MITSFRHKGLEKFFTHNVVKGIQPAHATKLDILTAALDAAVTIDDLNVPSWRLHLLNPKNKGVWSLTVNGNWRLTFRFIDGNVEDLDYTDYH